MVKHVQIGQKNRGNSDSVVSELVVGSGEQHNSWPFLALIPYLAPSNPAAEFTKI